MTPTLRAHLAILAATLLIGGSFLASAALAGSIDPVALTLLRFVAASALMAPLALSSRERRVALRRALPPAALISGCYAGFFACLFTALETTTALNTSALYTLVPFVTALLCRVVLGTPLTAPQLGAFLLGTAATCWVVFRADVERLLAFALLPGDGLFLLGALLMCGYSLGLRTLQRGQSQVVMTFAILLTGAGWMAAVLLLTGRPLDWQRLDAGDAAAMVYLVVGATLLTVPLTRLSTVALGPTRVMAWSYLTPGVVAGLLWLDGAAVPPEVWPGVALSALATLWLQRGDRAPGAATRAASMLALGSLLTALPACQPPAPPASPGVTRVAWSDARAADRPRVAIPHGWSLPADRRGWTVHDAREHVTEYPVVGHWNRAEWLLRALPPLDAFALSHAGPFDPTAFGQLVVRARVPVDVHVRGQLLRDGVPQGETVGGTLSSRQATATVVLRWPAALRSTAPCDELRLLFEGSRREVGLVSVELRDQPAVAVVPHPDDGPALVGLGEDARRGVGLATDWPLEAELLVPADGLLTLSVGVPPLAGRPDALRLVLGLGDGVEPRRERLPLGLPGAWQSWRLDLGEHAGQRVTLGCELESDAPAAAVLAETQLSSGAAAPRRSVLLVTSDTHRADHLAAMPGSVALETPTLDALAARGLLFEDCFAAANLTNPAHVAIMTGLHPRDHGILDNATALTHQAATLAERFADAGWVTWAAVSARHLDDDRSGLGQGFDRLHSTALTSRPAGRSVDVLEDWLPDAEGRDLFVWLHLFDAHTPYHVPAEFDRRYDDGASDPFDPELPDLGLDARLPISLKGLRDLRYPRAQYRALVTYLDHELARIVERPRFRDGVVGFLADHGESLGAHGIHFRHDQLYPDSIHVPLVLSWPDAPAGQRVRRPVSQPDVGRTLLDLAGLAHADFPGTSLLDGTPGVDPPPRFALAAHGNGASVTWRGLHLILHLTDVPDLWERHRVELYDLAADPGCTHELLDERPDAVRELRAALITWLRAAEARYASGAEHDDPESLAALHALGYTQSGEPVRPELWIDDDCAWCLQTD